MSFSNPNHGDFVDSCQWDEGIKSLEQSREARKQRELENNILSQQKEIIKLKREIAERDKDNAIQDIKRYLDNLTPRSRSELEALLTQLGITLPEKDLTNIADLGKEYVNKTENLKNTAIDESAEQDLEKYLSKLTSEKREELEDILGRFRETSAKLDELNKKEEIMNKATKKTELSPIGYIIAAILTLIVTFPLWYSIFV